MPASDSCGARLYAVVQHAVATDIQLSVGIFGLASLAIASIAAPYGVGTWILLYYAASIQLLETVIWAFRWMPCVGSLITLSEEMQTRIEVMHRQCMQPIEHSCFLERATYCRITALWPRTVLCARLPRGRHGWPQGMSMEVDICACDTVRPSRGTRGPWMAHGTYRNLLLYRYSQHNVPAQQI